jgi:hypothetical protein
MVQPNARSRPVVTIILEGDPNLSLSITDILELFNFTIREFKVVTNRLKSNNVKETERKNTVTNARMVRSTQKTARLWRHWPIPPTIQINPADQSMMYHYAKIPGFADVDYSIIKRKFHSEIFCVEANTYFNLTVLCDTNKEVTYCFSMHPAYIPTFTFSFSSIRKHIAKTVVPPSQEVVCLTYPVSW